MSPRTLQIVIAFVLLVHGIGHTMGVLPAVGASPNASWNSRSWLLTPLIGQPATNIVNIVIWVLTTIGFILAALALLGWGVPYEWWRPLALGSAVLSMIGLILFWGAFAMFFNKAGAIGVNLAVLIGLLYMQWPTDVDLGIL